MPRRCTAPPQQRDVADRFGGRGQEQPSGLPRQGCQLAEEALLEAVDQRGGTGGADGPERQLRRRQPSWQLQQGERVAVALGQDAVPDPRVEGAGHRRVEQPSGVAAAQPVHHELREPGQDGLLVGLADGEHHGHGLDPQTAGDELQRLRRRPVQPLGVVDDTEQGQFLGDLAEQGEDRQAHQEAVRARRPAAARRPSRARRAAGREPVQPLQVRAAELVQAGVGELHLGLDTGGAGDPAAGAPGRRGSRARRSCRFRPLRAAPGTGCGPPSRRRRGRSASRTRVPAPAGPAVIGSRSISTAQWSSPRHGYRAGALRRPLATTPRRPRRSPRRPVPAGNSYHRLPAHGG